MALQAESRGSDLLVTWEVNADLKRDATAALLSIHDDGQSSEVKLSAHEFQTGKVLFTPTGPTTQFRLTVYAPHGLTVQHNLLAENQRAPSVETVALNRRPAPVKAPPVVSPKREPIDLPAPNLSDSESILLPPP